MLNFNSNQLNISSSLADLSKSDDKHQSKVIYNEGCGIAFVNEKTGEIDPSTVSYFETGVSLRQISGYLKVLAEIKGFIILEGAARKMYQFVEDEMG